MLCIIREKVALCKQRGWGISPEVEDVSSGLESYILLMLPMPLCLLEFKTIPHWTHSCLKARNIPGSPFLLQIIRLLVGRCKLGAEAWVEGLETDVVSSAELGLTGFRAGCTFF